MAAVGHVIVLFSDPAQHQLLVAIDYFNTVLICVRLPFHGTATLLHSHAVDILSGTEIEAEVSATSLTSVPWAPTHRHGHPIVIDLIRRRLERLIRNAQERGESAEIDRIINEVLGPPDGRRLRRAEIRSVVERVKEIVLSRIR